MKNTLLVFFDIANQRNSDISLAAGSLLAYAKGHPAYGLEFEVEYHSFKFSENDRPHTEEMVEELAAGYNLVNLSSIALGCYAWAEDRINSIMELLRKKGFAGDFILGGYQIQSSFPLELQYPLARYFIVGPGEVSLVRAVLECPQKAVLEDTVKFETLPSPYLSGIIPLEQGQTMVRMETQRGCSRRCSFCMYHGQIRKISPFSLDRVKKELQLFKATGVQKINILDPEFFHSGNPEHALTILKLVHELEIQAQISVQVRFEPLASLQGEEFLDLCQGLNVQLEFGLQTIHKEEYKAIKRTNNLEKVEQVLSQLEARKIAYEVTLIYGLPLQTPKSFKQSIEFLKTRGCQRIFSYPLMLFRGTGLSEKRTQYGLKEDKEDGYGIPFVTSSHSFTFQDWKEMENIATQTAPSEKSPSQWQRISSDLTSRFNTSKRLGSNPQPL